MCCDGGGGGGDGVGGRGEFAYQIEPTTLIHQILVYMMMMYGYERKKKQLRMIRSQGINTHTQLEAIDL